MIIDDWLKILKVNVKKWRFWTEIKYLDANHSKHVIYLYISSNHEQYSTKAYSWFCPTCYPFALLRKQWPPPRAKMDSSRVAGRKIFRDWGLGPFYQYWTNYVLYSVRNCKYMSYKWSTYNHVHIYYQYIFYSLRERE